MAKRVPHPYWALTVDTHENWQEATRYLNMEHLRERKKELLRQAV